MGNSPIAHERPTRMSFNTVIYSIASGLWRIPKTANHNYLRLAAMQSEITVTISHQNEVVFSSTKTAQSMKEEGYQQPDLQTDNEPLPKLKEGELLYLGAAIEVIRKTGV